MKLAIMQPYFFPYIGYFQLIVNTDLFVFFETVQYNKKSWMNRNRILHPTPEKEFQYISVPVKQYTQGTLISEILIDNDQKWKEKILGQLTLYKKLKAPYYQEVMQVLDFFFQLEHRSLLELSMTSTQLIMQYLHLPFNFTTTSEIIFQNELITAPGDWAFEISKSLQANEYINPHGGYYIFDEEKFRQNGIGLNFIKPNLSAYRQSNRQPFEPGLSIIDVMMFNSIENIVKMLSIDYKLLSKKELEFRNA